jgi:hypothetical protein
LRKLPAEHKLLPNIVDSEEKPRKIVVRNLGPVNANTLVGTLKMRRGEKAGSYTCCA